MKIFKFRTEIKNDDDLKVLESHLLGITGIIECKCKLDDPGRILTVKAQGLSRDIIARDIFKAGVRNEPLNSMWERTVGKLFKKDCCK